MEKFSPVEIERLNKSRAESDKELIVGGAKIEFDGQGSYQLFPSEGQIESLRNEMEHELGRVQKEQYVKKEFLKMYETYIEAGKERLKKQLNQRRTGYQNERSSFPIRIHLADLAHKKLGDLIGPKELSSVDAQAMAGKLSLQTGIPTMAAGARVEEINYEKAAYEAVLKLDVDSSSQELRDVEEKLRKAALWALQYGGHDKQSRGWLHFSQEVLKVIESAIRKNRKLDIEKIGVTEMKASMLDFASALRFDKDCNSLDLDIISEKIEMDQYLQSLAQTESVIFLSRYDMDLPK